MNLLKTFDNRQKGYIYESTINRVAVRAIIFREDKILLVHSLNSEEYKFPGGGVENGETKQSALKREVLEEVGMELLNIGKCLGYTEQIYADIYNNKQCFQMRSYYYYCEVKDTIYDLKLSKYEQILGFVPEWVTLDKAIKLNEYKLRTNNEYPWTERELYIFKLLNNMDVSKGFE